MGMKKLFFVIVAAQLLGGCVRAPIFHEKMMPPVAKVSVYALGISPATKWLDCLSAQLSLERSASIKVIVGTIPNVLGLQVAGISLPSTLNPNVEHSFSRITSVYRVFHSKDLEGAPGLSQLVPHLGGAQERLARDLIAADVINPQYLIAGELMSAQEIKSGNAMAEAYGAGLSGEVRAYDITAKLQAVNATTREIATDTALTIRFYTASQGGSVFRLNSSELIQGQLTFTRGTSASHALQYLSDVLVAATVRDLSSAVLQKSFSICNEENDEIGVTRVGVKTKTNVTMPVKLKITKSGSEICITGEGASAGVSPNESVSLLIRQFASGLALNIPNSSPVLRSKVRAYQLLNGALCLPRSILAVDSKNIEVEVFNENGERLGIVADGL